MSVLPISQLKDIVPRGARLLGLDIGTKTIGLALSDPMWTVATSFETIRRTKFTKDAERLFAIVDEHKVGALILGLPVNMNGTEGPRCQSVRQFASNIVKIRDIPIVFWDERWSTAAAERALIEADTSRKKRAEVIDKVAASYILQGALDRLAAG
jgi:putative Holliday junction resolvase